MARCEIQWIDSKGNPTPDTDEAVCLAVSTMDYIASGAPREVRKFPCCAKHAEELGTLVGRGKMVATDKRTGDVHFVSQWTREELPMNVAVSNVS
jgi:hypothetical protein